MDLPDAMAKLQALLRAASPGQPEDANLTALAVVLGGFEALDATAATLPDLMVAVSDQAGALRALGDLRDVIDHLREHLDETAGVLWDITVPGARDAT